MSDERLKKGHKGGEKSTATMADKNCAPQDRSAAPVLSASQLSAASIKTANSISSNNNNNNNPIRHRGRALVRGKFRRVWRPRHLEVLSNGLVRYYEVPEPHGHGHHSLDVFVDSGALLSSSNSNNSNDYQEDDTGIHYPHSKIPKNTLAIHHARIIDVTTLRDMHVGLPRGSFGFLFHGQQIDDEDLGGASGDEDIFHLMGQCQGNTNLATPRDFLCAVNSLEEAQSWVIALQWAASMGRDASFHSESLRYTLPSVASHDESWADPHEDGVSISSSSLTSPPRQSETSPTLSHKQQSPASVSKTTTPASSKSKQSTPTKQSAAGKMIVTKVVGYTLVRLVESWKWEIAYQVSVLLVMPTQQHQQVQQWSILRTGQDIKNCIEKIMSGSLSATTSQKVHQQTERIAVLPNMQSSPQGLVMKDLDNSISVVDTVLRSFCMEAAVVNSPCMKRFLGLHHHSSVNSLLQGSPFWEIHNPYAVLSRPKHTIIQQGIDQFVKKWLQQPRQKRGSADNIMFQLLCWYLRLPQPSTTYAGAVLLSLWLSSSTLPSVNRFIEKYQLLPYVSIRLDALLLSWCAAAGLGNIMGGNRRLQTSAPSSSSRGTSGRRLSGSKNREIPPVSSPGGTGRPPKSPTNGLPDNKDVTRPKFTRTKSLMDEDDSEDNIVEDGEEDDIGDESGSPEDDEDGSPAVESTTSFMLQKQDSRLSSPLPEYSADKKVTESCWSIPKDNIFNVRGPSYLTDKVKIPSGNASFTCEGVDMWMTDDVQRDIARHPSVLGGRLANADKDMFLVNFLLPFGNFVSYFSIPPLEDFANPQLADVWTRFIEGDQQYRDARLKLLPVVVDGPWIVRAAVPGTSPALLGKVIPLQYFFTQKPNGRSVYEVDVIITASSIAKGILSVVKGHAKALSIAFAFIIEAAEEHELPETVLASFQVNSLHLEDCPLLPDMQ